MPTAQCELVGTRSLSSGARSRDPLALPTLRCRTGVVIPANGSAEWPPDDRLRRVSSTPQLFDFITDASEYWIARWSLSSGGAHSRDPLARNDA